MGAIIEQDNKNHNMKLEACLKRSRVADSLRVNVTCFDSLGDGKVLIIRLRVEIEFTSSNSISRSGQS